MFYLKFFKCKFFFLNTKVKRSYLKEMPFKKNIIPKYCGNFMTFIFKVNYGGLKVGFPQKEKLKTLRSALLK